jgi:hypothetical protein
VLKPRAALEDIGHRPRRRSGGASLLSPRWATSAAATTIGPQSPPPNRPVPQHFLNFCPLPQGHGAFRPTLGVCGTGAGPAARSAAITAGNWSSGNPPPPNCSTVLWPTTAVSSLSSSSSKLSDTGTGCPSCLSPSAWRLNFLASYWNARASGWRPACSQRALSHPAMAPRSLTPGVEYPWRRSCSALA